MVARPEIVVAIPEVGVVAVVVVERKVGEGVVAAGVAGQALLHPPH